MHASAVPAGSPAALFAACQVTGNGGGDGDIRDGDGNGGGNGSGGDGSGDGDDDAVHFGRRPSMCVESAS